MRNEGRGGRSLEGGRRNGRAQGTLSDFIYKGGDQGVSIVVDHREGGSAIVGLLEGMGARIELRNLKVGDYVVSDEVAVERKTVADFAASIVDRRLFAQARAMKEAYARPLLLIEGGGQQPRGVSKEAIRGALISTILDFGVPVIMAADAEEAACIVMAVAKREQSSAVRGISLKDRRRPQTPDEEKEYVVASLPMVEATLAKRLLEEFGSVEGVFSASEEDLQRVEKIGPKKAKRIREVAAGRYGAPKAEPAGEGWPGCPLSQGSAAQLSQGPAQGFDFRTFSRRS